MMHALYQVLSTLVFSILIPLSWLHPKLARGVRRRLGAYGTRHPWPASRGGGPRIWLHGASAGDILALLPTIARLREFESSATLIVSTMTNSGFAMAERRCRALVDGITYVPYDLSGATRRAVEVIRPDLLVLEYTEIWPNLIHAARMFGARTALTNGRIGERYMTSYRILSAVFGNAFAKLDLLLMRSAADAQRVLSLGAPCDRVRVTGNTKFDNASDPPEQEIVDALRSHFAVGDELVLVAGSTHEGEEAGLFDCFARLRTSFPSLRFLVAPRYPERASRVAALARKRRFSVALRTESSRVSVPRADVLVLDTIGELSAAYALASVVVVGGSFVARGGQNILEPASVGRPVVCGPHMENFRDAVDLLLGRGAIRVSNFDKLVRVLFDLLEREDERARLGSLAKSAVSSVRGAAKTNAEQLLELARHAHR